MDRSMFVMLSYIFVVTLFVIKGEMFKGCLIAWGNRSSFLRLVDSLVGTKIPSVAIYSNLSERTDVTPVQCPMDSRVYVTSTHIVNNGEYGRDWIIYFDFLGKPHLVFLSIPIRWIDLQEYLRPVCQNAKPKYWLYTRTTINNPEEILMPVQNKTNYIPNAPLVVLVHGWLCNRTCDSVQFVKNAILTAPNRNDNVIIMDWSKMLNYSYILSAEATSKAAEKLIDFMQSLRKTYRIASSNIHFVGHSLGAHVVGLAGIGLKRKNFTISRVTGLDPANPLFEFPPLLPGITKDAAAFVDIIHTSAGTMGIREPAGHVDFYPGGGRWQPAVCPPSLLPGSCEHSSSFIYFQKSFTKKFEARKCYSYFLYRLGFCNYNDVQYMGEPCEHTARGTYYLDIRTSHMHVNR